MNRHRDLAPRAAGSEKWAGQVDGSSADKAQGSRPSLVLDQSLHLVHEVPGQLQDVFGVVPFGHF